MEAAGNDDPNTVRALLAAGADRTAQTAAGLTAADIAADQGYVDVVEILTGG